MSKPNRIAELRLLKGVSQEELAKEVGVSPSAIAMYEIGERTPGLKNAKIIADYFGVPIEYIFFGACAHEVRAETEDGVSPDDNPGQMQEEEREEEIE